MKTAKEIKQASIAKWDVKKAGNRLLWRFSKDDNGKFKNFTPNESDLGALHTVLEWINRQENVNVRGHVLFAKLYIYFLTQGIRYHGTTVFDNHVQRELSSLLEKPFHLFYDAFITDLYGNQLNKLNKQSIDQFDKTMLEVEQFKKVFTEDYIKSKLNEMISEALNRFS